MKKILKWLIPCLVACFMVAGLVQTTSFTFANGDTNLPAEEQIPSESEIVEEQQPEEPSGQGGSEVGEDLEENVEDTKVTTIQPSNQFKMQKPGSGVDTYDADLDPYESFIKVTKVIGGLETEQINGNLSNFYIDVSGNQLYLNTDSFVKNYEWSWTLYGTGTGEFVIKEFNETVPDYILTKTINGTEWTNNEFKVSVAKKNLSITNPVWDDTATRKEFTVSENDGLNKILVANVGQGKKIVVISAKKLPISTQKAIEEYILKELPKHPGKWKTEGGIHFYSLDDLNDEIGKNDSITVNLEGKEFTYYPNNKINVVFGPSNINANMTLDFTYVDGKDADIVITNTYSPETKEVTVNKEWICDKETNGPDDRTDVQVALYDSEGKIIEDSEGGIKTITAKGTGKCSWIIPKTVNVGYVRELSGDNPIGENGEITLNGKTFKVEYISGNVDSNTGNQTFTVRNTKLCTLTVVKEIKGSAAVTSDKFKINVTLTYGNDKTEDIAILDGKETEEGKTPTNTKVYENIPYGTEYTVEEDSSDENLKGYSPTYQLNGNNVFDKENKPASKVTGTITSDTTVTVINTKEAVPLTGIVDNTPKGLGMIGTIVAEVVAIAFVLKKKRQLKM